MSQIVLSTDIGYSSHTELIVFIHILKIVFVLQNKLLFFDNFLMQKLNNDFFFVTFFL